jgi:phage terminase large subunit
MTTVRVNGGMTPRHYQRPYMDAMDAGCKFAVWVMHRRGGKDRTALAQVAKDSFKQVGLYWHCLPTLKQARKVVWDNIASEGKNLIDATFPRELIAKQHQDEMKIVLRNGSIVQLVGADNFNSLVGASPRHVTFSEWSLTDPRAYDFVRPILRENKGSVSFIYTPRGYNHGWKTLQIAKKLPGAFCALMPITATGVLTEADMALERAEGMAEELIQQEYYCDFSAANVGAVLGSRISKAERAGRLHERVLWSPGSRVVVSSDIGYRDTAAFWWWQINAGGFELLHYDEGSGLDADDWVGRLQAVGLPIHKLYLPHDAKAKTFQTKRSVIETMSMAFECEIVPQARVQDRINAARVVAEQCEWNSSACERGLEVLRAWSFAYDDDRKVFSSEPDHNWASHGGDAFSYGALVLQTEVATPKPRVLPKDAGGAHHVFTLDDLWDTVGPRTDARLE